MEPFERDPLSEQELDGALKEWKAPDAPARLRAAVFGERLPWWRRTVRVPVPVFCAAAGAMILLAAVWLRPAPAAGVVVRTERVEVPVVQERVVYRECAVAPAQGAALVAWRPVKELTPRIIRSGNAQN